MDGTDRWTGRVIDGRYAVESVLGQGGMGVVLRARHTFTGAQVALKMLQPDMQMNVEAKERFLSEAQTPTSIGHPGIVQVMDAGMTPEGELYIAMELLTGRTLRQALYPTLPPQVARRVTLELLDALGAAHARGIVHRDMKPENVFLVGPASTVKLLDFGIAKGLQMGRTAAGMMLGTLSYMAPEQLSDASSVDARADLWAVGVMVYEMLSGKLPFRGTTLVEIMTALATQEPDPIRVYLTTATPAMDAFFARALSRDRNQRFASAQDMALAVSAMQLDGTAPGNHVISTLTGLGSPKSNQMTAADSGPQIPSRQPFTAPVAAQVASAASQPLFTPHVPPPGSPSAPQPSQPTPSAPFSAQTPAAPTPSAPFTAQTPAAPTPSAPFAAQPAMTPRAPFPAQPTPPPAYANSYGFTNNPGPGMPTQGGKKGSAGFDKTSWIVIGSALGLIVIVVAVLAVKKSQSTSGFDECEEACAALSQCNSQIDVTDCQWKCGFEKATEVCIDQAAGSCEAFQSCMESSGTRMPLKRSFNFDSQSGDP